MDQQSTTNGFPNVCITRKTQCVWGFPPQFYRNLEPLKGANRHHICKFHSATRICQGHLKIKFALCEIEAGRNLPGEDHFRSTQRKKNTKIEFKRLMQNKSEAEGTFV